MADPNNNLSGDDFLIKKKKGPKKRPAAVLDLFDEFTSGSSLVQTAVDPTNGSTETIPPANSEGLGNRTNNDDHTHDSGDDESHESKGYVKKARINLGFASSDEINPIVQLQTKAEIAATAVGKETATISKKIAQDLLAQAPASMTTMQARTAGTLNLHSTIDYAADICKDFKQFGYCRWGDECIFSHDRSERKSGNQLDLEYQASLVTNAERRAQARQLVIPEQDQLPTHCEVCGETFPDENELTTPGTTISQNITMTLCKHFFHQQCALTRFNTGDKTCFQCQKDTKGRLTPAVPELQRRAAATIQHKAEHQLKLERLDEEDKKGNRKAMLGGGY